MSFLAKNRPRSNWLLALPAAWATSGLLALTDGALWSILPLAMLAFAMAGRHMLMLLLAVALPIQGFAGVAAEIRGPGHIHSHERAAAPHWHDHVEHHHHGADEPRIEVEDKSASQAALAGDDKRAVPVDALSSALTYSSPPTRHAAACSDPVAPPAPDASARPERPPRPLA